MSTDKTVVITGESQGIGAGLIKSFLDRGWNVVGTSRRVSKSSAITSTRRLAARTACLSGLAAARLHLGTLRITSIAKLGVYIAAPEDFREHPKVAGGASELLSSVFGHDKVPPRIVLGVSSIPLGMPVEIELLFEIEK
ncbi:hypothetical protein HJB86_32240 [Rhizobium sp. NZLR3b]|uniref:RidA family protein n=1 Tax=Rhizobium sp. NZLR3b TaxID=2731101 RepID=UPI002180A155|nr:Atu1372/SO_1960 family protein [Rhizobium sp. NZLR3b]MBX5193505.1 hypothetical protein [Rhizobium sp. NZLR3b]